MGKPKSLAQQIAEIDGPLPKDFDPEEDALVQSTDEGSASEAGNDDLAGIEHYEQNGKSKLRKANEVSLGPQYAGARVSRDSLINAENDTEESEQEEDGSEDSDDEDRSAGDFADPDDVDMHSNEGDGDDSEAAFGKSDDVNSKSSKFRGSATARLNGTKGRLTAADFMSDGENDGDDLEGGMSKPEDEEIRQDNPDSQRQALEQQGSDFESEESTRHDNVSTDEDDGPSRNDENSDTSDVEDDEGSSDGEGDDGDSDAERRAEIREIMKEDQTSVVATISQAAKSDAEKGFAVKQQREAFGFLVSIRMTLQKALVATNSMVALKDQQDDELATAPYEAAEAAALKLWNTLDGIRHQLVESNTSTQTGLKRKRPADTSTPLASLWDRMQVFEVAALDARQATLEKWSTKIRSGTAPAVSRKLNPTTNQQSITSVLQDQLASSEHLIQKTKIPRSCAPIQRDAKLTEDPDIYDDATFYQLVLKEFVDQKRMDALANPSLGGESAKVLQLTASKEAKTRKNVDTKASKGRKLRYTVHEKLQNFMAPEDRGSWEQEAVDRFFGALLGQKMSLREEDEPPAESDGGGGVSLGDEALMLFRS